MPQPQAPKKPKDDRPEPEEAPRRKFRHQIPPEEDAGETPEHGHGSGCIPVILIRISILAILIWLACIAGGVYLARHATHPASSATSAR